MARPKEAILSRNLIRDQALAIIDEDGLDGLTMRRLATRLGVQAPSLYTHFPNKEAVLASVAERLALRIDPDGFAGSWQDGLRTWADSYYSAIHWHPRAAPIVASGALDDLSKGSRVRAGLGEHGWPEREATMVAAAVRYLVLGAATAAAGDADDLAEASFAVALDSLLHGFESVHAALPDGVAVRAG